MEVVNIRNEELRFQPSIESHKEVLEFCNTIECLYNVEIFIEHDNAMEYKIVFKDKDSKEVLCKTKNYPGKVKNYLKGLIDAKKIFTTE